MAALKKTWVVLLLLPLPAYAQTVLDAYLANLELHADILPFSAQRGSTIWHRQQEGRACTRCHLESVHSKGRHERTGKVIEPMAPSVNAERLTEAKKMDKWFLRNCKWTLGRECTAQEKGDVLTWLRDQ